MAYLISAFAKMLSGLAGELLMCGKSLIPSGCEGEPSHVPAFCHMMNSFVVKPGPFNREP